MEETSRRAAEEGPLLQETESSELKWNLNNVRHNIE